MQEMGITARLDEVVSAPPVIKHVLNGQAALDYSVSKPHVLIWPIFKF